ncbi:MAG: glycosyltransferase [Sulfuritalea sp.]|nr:glycosyltransferase [Sulfuritalea sp.]
MMAADVHCPATAAQGVRVTVGVASYNRPELLRRAIRSAVSQTYKNLEILISDNGSPNPEVRRVIEEFARSDTRIRCIFHPVNQGAFFNFRSVFTEANG